MIVIEDQPLSLSLSLLKRKRGDWVLDMGVVDGPDVTNSPVLEDNIEVFCLSQDA